MSNYYKVKSQTFTQSKLNNTLPADGNDAVLAQMPLSLALMNLPAKKQEVELAHWATDRQKHVALGYHTALYFHTSIICHKLSTGTSITEGSCGSEMKR